MLYNIGTLNDEFENREIKLNIVKIEYTCTEEYGSRVKDDINRIRIKKTTATI